MAVTLRTFLKENLKLFFLAPIIIICSADLSYRFLEKKGNLTYGNFLRSTNNSVLQKNDSVLSTIEVPNDIECASQCVMNSLCLSVNYGVDPNKKGRVKCELLSWGGTDYRNYLVKKEGFFHMRMQTICSTNPCGMGAYCIPRLNDSNEKPFSCTCPRSSQECLTGNIKCNALGVEAGTIVDAQMTAASVFSAFWAAHNGRLNKPNSNWVPSGEDGAKEKSWLQVDLRRYTTVVGVATQGRYDNVTRWAKTYQLNFSDDGITWATYKEDGVEKTFQGNVNNFDVVKHEMKEPFVAKLVRIVPKTWLGAPALRIELYGC